MNWCDAVAPFTKFSTDVNWCDAVAHFPFFNSSDDVECVETLNNSAI